MPFLALPFCRLREASTIGSQAWTQSADCKTQDRIEVETTNPSRPRMLHPIGCRPSRHRINSAPGQCVGVLNFMKMNGNSIETFRVL
jgi:hypothetical protein